MSTAEQIRQTALREEEKRFFSWRKRREEAGLPCTGRLAYAEYLKEKGGPLGRLIASRVEAIAKRLDPEIQSEYRRLARWFDQAPDLAPGKSERDHEMACDGVVWLIGWIEDHPEATRAHLDAEKKRIRKGGRMWAQPGGARP